MSLPKLVVACLICASPCAAQGWEAVEAILEALCGNCHSGEDAPLGLSLDTHAGLMTGSENGPVVDLDAPSQSALISRLRGETEPRMPLDGPPWLEANEIATLESWIGAGAPGPAASAAQMGGGRSARRRLSARTGPDRGKGPHSRNHDRSGQNRRRAVRCYRTHPDRGCPGS